MAGSDNISDSIQTQIENVAKTAFRDVIRERMERVPPDYEMLSRLYREIRDRLMHITPNRPDIQKRIYESMDDEIFIRSIQNDAFSPSDMNRLVSYCFERILEYEAPSRNQSTIETKNHIINQINKPVFKFSEIVPEFVLEFHTKMDELEDDIKSIKEQMKRISETIKNLNS